MKFPWGGTTTTHVDYLFLLFKRSWATTKNLITGKTTTEKSKLAGVGGKHLRVCVRCRTTRVWPVLEWFSAPGLHNKNYSIHFSNNDK